MRAEQIARGVILYEKDRYDLEQEAALLLSRRQPAGAHDAYHKGDRVKYHGKIYESTMDGNVWEPGVTGWIEVEL